MVGIQEAPWYSCLGSEVAKREDGLGNSSYEWDDLAEESIQSNQFSD
jgi:hypothetical protein